MSSFPQHEDNMSKHSELTNREINLILHKVLIPCFTIMTVKEVDNHRPYISWDGDSVRDNGNGGMYDSSVLVPDYCNNWVDTGPLAIKYDICIGPNPFNTNESKISWYKDDGPPTFTLFGPVLRAICECILLIKDGE